jgi:pseudo-rSAM protein
METKLLAKQGLLLMVEPYVYINRVTNSQVLLYNEFTNKRLICNDRTVYEIVTKLEDKKSYRIVEITREELDNKEVKNFITQGRENFMLDIIPVDSSSKKPIQFIPNLVVRNIRDRNLEKKEMYGEDILHNLTELFFLFGTGKSDNKNFGSFNLQIPFYYDTNCQINIKLEELKGLFNELKYSSLNKIHLVGDQLINEDKYNDLLDFLTGLDLIKEIYINASSVSSGLLNKIDQLSMFPGVKFNLIVDELNRLENTFKFHLSKDIFHYIFLVKNEANYLQISEFNEINKLNSATLTPVFTSDNSTFFEENIFTSVSDIDEINPSQLDLYRNQKMNTLFFGKLYINAKGIITSNICSEPLGRCGKDSIAKIVLDEMLNGENWFRIRSKFSPCKECIYRDFCQPISNYELAIGKVNLCNIR